MQYTTRLIGGVESLVIEGKDVCSILLSGGCKWVPVKAICAELGLQHDAQRRRLMKSSWARHCSLRVVAADGKRYLNFCLHTGDLDMWLSTLTKSRLKGSPTTAYFIRSHRTGYIKIGTSVNARERLHGLANGYPDCFELLAVGGVEAELHDQLDRHRVHGEWFHPHADVLKALRRAGGRLGRPIEVAGMVGCL